MEYNKLLDDSKNIDTYYKNLILDEINRCENSSYSHRIENYILIYAIKNKLFDTNFIIKHRELFNIYNIYKYMNMLDKNDFIRKYIVSNLDNLDDPFQDEVLIYMFDIENSKFSIEELSEFIIQKSSKFKMSMFYRTDFYWDGNKFHNVWKYKFLHDFKYFEKLNDKSKLYIHLYNVCNGEYRNSTDIQLINLKKIWEKIKYNLTDDEKHNIFDQLNLKISTNETYFCGLYIKYITILDYLNSK